MVSFGGLGGIRGGRQIDPDDLFEAAVEQVLGERIREYRHVAIDMWCALANIEWRHVNGDTAAYSFRAAGDLVAAIRGEGDYLDWYCSGREEVVSDEIQRAMGEAGWTFTVMK